MIPKIIFRRSFVYDQKLKRDVEFATVSDEVIEKHLNRMKAAWETVQVKVLEEIARVTKLEWHEQEIVCYVVPGVNSFSDPLTLNLRADIHTITHELIHRILIEPENKERFIKNWKRILHEHKDEPQYTRTHIIILAIHTYILKKLFSEEEFQKEKKSFSRPEGIRSWELVEKIGYENIIKELTHGL